MNTLTLFDLTIPAPRRLAMMRKAFAEHATKYPHCPETIKPKSWRDIRGTTHGSIEAYCGCLDQGFNGEGFAREPIWYTHQGQYFRRERDAHAIVRHLHTGWYTDEFHDDTAVGIVASLPHGRFLAGYRWTCNDERVYFSEVFDNEHDAAYMADEHARVFAEREREFQAEESARLDAAEVEHESHEAQHWAARGVETRA